MMHLCKRAALVAGLSLTLAAAASAHDNKGHAPAVTHPGLEKLKALAGDWATDDGAVSANYRVTAGGSAVMETLFPGTPHEMVTIFHQDGKDLVLTHYCAAQNQPKMKAAANSGADKLQFSFAGGSNLNASKDGHMHDAVIQFVDADTLHNEWVYFEGGKKQDTKVFDLKRKKS